MFCTKCGKSVKDNNFCPYCGNKIHNNNDAMNKQDHEHREIQDQYPEDKKNRESDNINSESPILKTEAVFMLDSGTLTLYSNHIVFSGEKRTWRIKLHEVKSVRKALEGLIVNDVHDIENFFRLDEKLVDLWMSEISKRIQKENTNSVEKHSNFQQNDFTKSEYQNYHKSNKNSKLLFKLLPVIALILAYFTLCGRTSDSDYIGCAETMVSKYLKAPSTASYSNQEVVEKDDYGRVLVTLTVDAQNGFGAYLRSNYAVVITSYNNKTGEFTYNQNAIQEWDDSENFLANACMRLSKEMSNWNEPIE